MSFKIDIGKGLEIVLDLKNLEDMIDAFLKKVTTQIIDKLKELGTAFIEAVKDLWNNCVDGLVNVSNKIGEILDEIGVTKAAKAAFDRAKGGVREAKNTLDAWTISEEQLKKNEEDQQQKDILPKIQSHKLVAPFYIMYRSNKGFVECQIWPNSVGSQHHTRSIFIKERQKMHAIVMCDRMGTILDKTQSGSGSEGWNPPRSCDCRYTLSLKPFLTPPQYVCQVSNISGDKKVQKIFSDLNEANNFQVNCAGKIHTYGICDNTGKAQRHSGFKEISIDDQLSLIRNIAQYYNSKSPQYLMYKSKIDSQMQVERSGKDFVSEYNAYLAKVTDVKDDCWAWVIVNADGIIMATNASSDVSDASNVIKRQNSGNGPQQVIQRSNIVEVRGFMGKDSGRQCQLDKKFNDWLEGQKQYCEVKGYLHPQVITNKNGNIIQGKAGKGNDYMPTEKECRECM